MMVIIHSRDNLKRVSIENRHRTTVLDLKQIIETQLGIPHSQPNPIHKPEPPALNLSHDSIVFLAYEGERRVTDPTFNPTGSFGRKMTVDHLIAK
ncbi:NPL4-like protein 1 [Glycine max]|nr:NPL4-like protein 1 [Glycine max]